MIINFLNGKGGNASAAGSVAPVSSLPLNSPEGSVVNNDGFLYEATGEEERCNTHSEVVTKHIRTTYEGDTSYTLEAGYVNEEDDLLCQFLSDSTDRWGIDVTKSDENVVFSDGTTTVQNKTTGTNFVIPAYMDVYKFGHESGATDLMTAIANATDGRVYISLANSFEGAFYFFDNGGDLYLHTPNTERSVSNTDGIVQASGEPYLFVEGDGGGGLWFYTTSDEWQGLSPSVEGMESAVWDKVSLIKPNMAVAQSQDGLRVDFYGATNLSSNISNTQAVVYEYFGSHLTFKRLTTTQAQAILKDPDDNTVASCILSGLNQTGSATTGFTYTDSSDHEITVTLGRARGNFDVGYEGLYRAQMNIYCEVSAGVLQYRMVDRNSTTNLGTTVKLIVGHSNDSDIYNIMFAGAGAESMYLDYAQESEKDVTVPVTECEMASTYRDVGHFYADTYDNIDVAAKYDGVPVGTFYAEINVEKETTTLTGNEEEIEWAASDAVQAIFTYSADTSNGIPEDTIDIPVHGIAYAEDGEEIVIDAIHIDATTYDNEGEPYVRFSFNNGSYVLGEFPIGSDAVSESYYIPEEFTVITQQRSGKDYSLNFNNIKITFDVDAVSTTDTIYCTITLDNLGDLLGGRTDKSKSKDILYILYLPQNDYALSYGEYAKMVESFGGILRAANGQKEDDKAVMVEYNLSKLDLVPDDTNIVTSDDIVRMVKITQSGYDELVNNDEVDESTFYIIVPDSE